MYETGWAKQNLGQLADALQDYEAAATKSRDHVGARARFMMGQIHFEKKEFDDAIRELCGSLCEDLMTATLPPGGVETFRADI